MKQYTHAWIAMMAVKRLDKATIPEADKPGAASLVKWFKNHKDDVITGAWYPDAIIKDMASSHILKLMPGTDEKVDWRKLPETYGLYKIGKASSLYKLPYKVMLGNLPDRCESLTHSIVDNLKMFESESKGSTIMPPEHHIAAIFFMLSHYLADGHMPLHCDARQFNEKKNLHADIEGDWDKRVRHCYTIDLENTRFIYDRDGNPAKDNTDPVIDYVEAQLTTRPFDSAYGPGNKNTWDIMSAVTQYSYATAYELVPAGFDIYKGDFKALMALITREKFEELSKSILLDTVDSVAKVWLRAWKRFEEWRA